jgi:hypothetical protein
MGWIEIFALADVTILGNGSPCFNFGFPQPPAANCFAVHANQFMGNGHGGLIRVTSTTGSAFASGRAIQINATAVAARQPTDHRLRRPAAVRKHQH